VKKIYTTDIYNSDKFCNLMQTQSGYRSELLVRAHSINYWLIPHCSQCAIKDKTHSHSHRPILIKITYSSIVWQHKLTPVNWKNGTIIPLSKKGT